MSPEQLRGQPLDARADVWSLGAVLFELLAGEAPFGTSDGEVPRLMQRIVNEPPRKLADLRPTAPPELGEIIERCLRKTPSERFASAAELAIALLKFAPKRARVAAERASALTRAAGLTTEDKLELPPSVAPPSMDPARTSSSIALADTVFAPAVVDPKKRRPAVLVLAALALLGAAALLMLRPQERKTSVGVDRTPPVVVSVAPAAATSSASLAANPTPPDPSRPSASAALSASADADASHSAARPAAPVVRRPSSPSPASSAKPDLDIRMTR
jgi:serine/threonine-protein kinase